MPGHCTVAAAKSFAMSRGRRKMSESPSRNIAMRAPASALAISDRTRDTLSRVLYPVLLGLPLGAFALLWKTAGWDPNLTIDRKSVV